MTSPTEAIALRVSIPEAVRIWEQCAADTRAAIAVLRSVEERLTAVFGTDDHGVHLNVRHKLYLDDPEPVIQDARDQVWRELIERMGIKQIMSAKRADALDKQLYNGHRDCSGNEYEELPDITIENVMGMLNGMHASIPEMANEAIHEVFRWLHPTYNKYASNKPFELGDKVVIGYGCERGFHTGTWRVGSYTENDFRALDNVFSFLDGRGFAAKTHRGELVDALNAATPDGRFETRYFVGRCFKNRNVHLTFKRLDLVAKLNQVAGGMKLKGKTT